MSILVFDCETSGLMRPGLPLHDPSQPHLLQLAAKLVSRRRKRMGRITLIIRPDGWTVEAEAEAHNRISEAMAYQAGVPVVAALACFRGMVEKADKIVAHHMEFDRAIVDLALIRTGSNPTWWRKRGQDLFCTMERSASLVAIEGKFGPDKYPSLEEAHDHFIPSMKPWKSNHDGEADADACERIYWAMEDRETL